MRFELWKVQGACLENAGELLLPASGVNFSCEQVLLRHTAGDAYLWNGISLGEEDRLHAWYSFLFLGNHLHQILQAAIESPVESRCWMMLILWSSLVCY